MAGKIERESDYNYYMTVSEEALSATYSESVKITELKADKKRAEWSAFNEQCAVYFVMCFVPPLFTICNLGSVFERWGAKYHAEYPDPLFSLEFVIAQYQSLGLMFLFFGFRLLALGFLAMPKYILCKTRLPQHARELVLRIKNFMLKFLSQVKK